MAECAKCGGHVSADFLRVFGVDGQIRGCPNCETKSKIAEAQRNE